MHDISAEPRAAATHSYLTTHDAVAGLHRRDLLSTLKLLALQGVREVPRSAGLL